MRRWQDAIGHAIRAGELLIRAKGQVAHGEWLPWLQENFPASVRSAQNYMRLARHAEDAQTLAHLGVEGALRELATHHDPDSEDDPLSPGVGDTTSPEGVVIPVSEGKRTGSISAKTITNLSEGIERQAHMSKALLSGDTGLDLQRSCARLGTEERLGLAQIIRESVKTFNAFARELERAPQSAK